MDLRSWQAEQAMHSEPGPECLEVIETMAAFYAIIYLMFLSFSVSSLKNHFPFFLEFCRVGDCFSSSFAEFAAILQNEAIQQSGGGKVKVLCGTSGMCDIGL